MDLGDAVMEVNRGIQEDPDPQEEAHRPPPRPLPTPSSIGWAMLFGFLLLAGWETATALTQHMSAPTTADWESAAANLKKKHLADEPVLFAPHWVSPLGRLHFAPFLDLERSALSDVARYRRVWQVSTRGALHPWLEGLEPVEKYHHGGVQLALFKKEAVEVTHDFTATVLKATVEKAEKGDKGGRKATRCELNGKRFTCAPQGWNWVGPHLAEVGHQPYRCIFAHAVDRHTMRITYPAVRLGRMVVGYTGIDDFENRKRNDSPVTLRVKVGHHTVGETVHQNDWPWTRFTADTSRFEGQTHPVHFEVETPHAYARTFCFAAEARK